MQMPELSSAFRQVGNWCQEYLELQHSTAVGQSFGRFLAALREVAVCPREYEGDRFERLKQLEREATDALSDLAVAHAEQLKSRQQQRELLAGRMSPRTTLFVYGTLKRGFCRSFALDGQRFIGPARTRPNYRLYRDKDYPCLVEAETGLAIDGELWEVDAACLRRLDEIEGVEFNLFTRARIALEPPHADEVVEAYFYRPSVRGLAECGSVWTG